MTQRRYSPIIAEHDYPDELIQRLCATTATPFMATIDLSAFVRQLCASLSLNLAEKIRVLDNLPILTQFQCEELQKVWLDEHASFDQLLTQEWPIIAGLCARSWHDALQLLREQGGQVDDAEALQWRTTLLQSKYNTPARERQWLLPLNSPQDDVDHKALSFYAMHPALAVLQLPETF